MTRKRTLLGGEVRVVDRGAKGFFLRWYDPERGKITERKVPGCTDPVEAGRAAAHKEVELRSAKGPITQSLLWSELVLIYEREYLHRTSASNQAKFRKISERFTSFCGGDIELTDISAGKLEQFESHLRKDLAPGSIPSNIATLRSALSWAVTMDLLETMPPKRRRGRDKAPDNSFGFIPPTEESVRSMIAAVADVVPEDRGAESFRRLVEGLWVTGFRLRDAMLLHWSGLSGHRIVDLYGPHPAYAISRAQKNRKDEIVPMTPQAVEFFRRISPADASDTGPVFALQGQRKDVVESELTVSRRVAQIGKAAAVNVGTRTNGKVKFASAQDLRKGFAYYWSGIVMPPLLMRMMRHSSIELTMKYYVGQNASEDARRILEAWSSKREGSEKLVAGG